MMAGLVYACTLVVVASLCVGANIGPSKDELVEQLLDRVQSLEGRLAQLETDPQVRHRRAQASAGVAFFTRLNKFQLGRLQLDQRVVLDEVVLNVGQGYHASTGIFSAPVAGIYTFSSALMSDMDEEVHMTITHNGSDVAHVNARGSGGRFDQGFQSVIIEMKLGDEVWMKISDYGNMTLLGDKYTTFSGHLLWTIPNGGQ